LNYEFEIEFVKLDSGNIPFIRFLDSLSNIEKADVLAYIEELRIVKGNNEIIPRKLSKHLKDGIFELRVKHQTRITRSLYFFMKDRKIVFTNGFIKKTEKTPNDEIEKAIRYKNIYLNR